MYALNENKNENENLKKIIASRNHITSLENENLST